MPRLQNHLCRPLFVLLLVAFMAALALVTPSPVDAVVPPATADSSVVTVRVGGDRVGTRSVAPLPGARLGLFAQADDAAPVAQPWATCTSDADGDCSFTVPDTASGGANEGTRFWVKQLSAPAGWFVNGSLRTGAGSGSGSVDNPYRFRTPVLTGGSTYSSQADFMVGSAGSGRPQEDSEGIWQDSRVNPALTAACGLDVAVVMDLSASVGSALPDLKNAASTFIDALVGTPSRVALFSFDAASPSSGADANYADLRPVATAGGADAVKSTYAGWTLGSGTNWDRGLWAVAQAAQTYELVVVITDGNPTRFSADPLMGTGGTTHFRDVENGIYSANAVKAKGSRVLAVGVGGGLDDISRHNLLALSGQTLYDGTNVEEADYYDADSYDEAGAALRQLALSQCEERLAIFKQIVPPGTTGEDITGAQPAGPGWTFDASTTVPAVVGLPAQQSTYDDTGAVYFDVDYPAGLANARISVNEQQQAGYELVTQNGDNATCIDRTDGDAAVAVDNAGGPASPGFEIDLPAGSFVVCTIYNRASAAIEVSKSWLVDGVAYDHGDQPDGIDAALGLTGPGAAGPGAQPWSTPRNGYAEGEAVTVTETTTIPSTCRLVSARVTRVDGATADAAIPYQTTASYPTRQLEITNTVDCTTTLTLRKRVINDDGRGARPDEWTLTGEGPTSLAGVSGASAVTEVPVEPGQYSLAENDGPDGYDQIGWACTISGRTVPVEDDQVTIARGDDVVCTVTNDDRPTGGGGTGGHGGGGGGGDAEEGSPLPSTGAPGYLAWLTALGLFLVVGGGLLIANRRP